MCGRTIGSYIDAHVANSRAVLAHMAFAARVSRRAISEHEGQSWTTSWLRHHSLANLVAPVPPLEIALNCMEAGLSGWLSSSWRCDESVLPPLKQVVWRQLTLNHQINC